MDFSVVAVGAKFIDPGFVSQPAEYRVHRVTELHNDYFMAEHVASGHPRRFPRTVEVVQKLTEIRSGPVLLSNLDGYIGDHVKIDLVDGGKLHGTVTAIRYNEVTLDGSVHRSVREVEIDRSGSTSYPFRDIKAIARTPRRSS